MSGFLGGFMACAIRLYLLGRWIGFGNDVPSRFWCAFWLIVPSLLFGALMADLGSGHG